MTDEHSGSLDTQARLAHILRGAGDASSLCLAGPCRGGARIFFEQIAPPCDLLYGSALPYQLTAN